MEIKNAGFTLDDYLRTAKRKASKFGYNPKLLTISDRLGYKLNYDGTNFGSSMNNDFIIYSMKVKAKQISLNDAKMKRASYIARASNIKGEWKTNPTSKNWLAIRILW